jgi:hypothetical protein
MEMFRRVLGHLEVFKLVQLEVQEVIEDRVHALPEITLNLRI